jgi:hypothetical protein
MVVVSEVARLTLFDSPDPEAGRLVARLWAVPAVLGVLLAGLAYRGDPGDGYALAAGGALLSLGLARAAAPLGLSWLREASMIAALAAINILADAAAWNEAVFAVALVILAVAATVASLWLWRANQGSPWVRSLVTLSVIANVETGVLAARAWPDRALLVAVLLSVAVQAVAVGTVRSRPAVLAIGPPATVAAFILAVAESVTGSAQWYTIPIGLAFLSEVEILRDVRRRADGDVKGLDVLVLEWAGIGLLIAPGLVEMFTTELAYGLIPFGLAGAILIWGIVTKVRRRVIAAASIAVVSAVLLIFAAAAGVAPSTAEFWIVAAGIGISVMLVAGLIEAYRSRRGRAMARLSGLMEGWE